MPRFLTKRRALLWATLLLTVSSAVTLALIWRNRLAQRAGVIPENFARIQLGMRKDTVEEILGRPPDRETYGGSDANGEYWFREWEEDGHWVRVLFVAENVRNWQTQEQRGPMVTLPPEPGPSLLTRLLRLLRLSY